MDNSKLKEGFRPNLNKELKELLSEFINKFDSVDISSDNMSRKISYDLSKCVVELESILDDSITLNKAREKYSDMSIEGRFKMLMYLILSFDDFIIMSNDNIRITPSSFSYQDNTIILNLNK